tara:strand:- start:675 stop:1619 length:945 start_codon:yes stop_codon:yes gene_type:complete
MKIPAVSIIIPVSNRSNLIRETLDSIIAQSYSNWECLIVDDGSLDNTLEVLEEFAVKDDRIKYYSRPKEKMKGANNCRNFGFEKSTGNYIIWFDSDDLMTPDHLEAKLRCIEQHKVDFVVARTQNFSEHKMLKPYNYKKMDYGIRASDFILLKIHWYTYDVMLRREIAKKISWNEQMKSWQDYNYFCKMLLETEKGEYLDEILTRRRIHSSSIQKSLTKNSRNFNTELLENRFLTYNDISEKIDAETRKELIFGMMNLCFELAKLRVFSKYIKEVVSIVESELGISSKSYFKLAMASASLTKKGYYFLNKAKQR